MTARMDLCDLIVSMEQAEISPRPVVGAIIVVSGVAVSFLLWLLYMHHASADFAGRWMFLPALNALLNGLCATALCVGLYFIKHHDRESHRASMLLAFAFSSVFLISYIVNQRTASPDARKTCSRSSGWIISLTIAMSMGPSCGVNP